MNTETERWIPEDEPGEAWFAVRQVLRHQLTTYEEQITIWKAPTFEEAARRARVEGELTADTLNAELLPWSKSSVSANIRLTVRKSSR